MTHSNPTAERSTGESRAVADGGLAPWTSLSALDERLFFVVRAIEMDDVDAPTTPTILDDLEERCASTPTDVTVREHLWELVDAGYLTVETGRPNRYQTTSGGRRAARERLSRQASMLGLAVQERARTDGGVAVDGLDDVRLQVHPHYVDSCGTPTFTFSDWSPMVRWTVDIEALDEDDDVEADWLVVEFSADRARELIAGDELVQEDADVGVRATITGEEVER